MSEAEKPVPTRYLCGCPIMYNETAWQMVERRCPEHGQRIDPYRGPGLPPIDARSGDRPFWFQ